MPLSIGAVRGPPRGLSPVSSQALHSQHRLPHPQAAAEQLAAEEAKREAERQRVAAAQEAAKTALGAALQATDLDILAVVWATSAEQIEVAL